MKNIFKRAHFQLNTAKERITQLEESQLEIIPMKPKGKSNEKHQNGTYNSKNMKLVSEFKQGKREWTRNI